MGSFELLKLPLVVSALFGTPGTSRVSNSPVTRWVDTRLCFKRTISFMSSLFLLDALYDICGQELHRRGMAYAELNSEGTL
jgi:hypothetical protein